MDEKTILLFDDYLQGVLSEKDKIDLEARLKDDAELQDAFAIFKDLNGHLSHSFSQERKEFSATLEQASTEYFNKDRKDEKETKVISFRPIRYLVAACMVMLFGAIFWLQMQEASYSDYSFKVSIDLVERSGSEDAFAKAEKAFNTKNYEDAITYFNTILVNDRNNAQVQYYLGIALVENGAYEAAKNTFSGLSNGDSVFKYEAQWYQALSLLKQGKEKDCLHALRIIPENASIYSKAQELIKKLD